MIYIYILLLFEGLQNVLYTHPVHVYATHVIQTSHIQQAPEMMESRQLGGQKEMTRTRHSD